MTVPRKLARLQKLVRVTYPGGGTDTLMVRSRDIRPTKSNKGRYKPTANVG